MFLESFNVEPSGGGRNHRNFNVGGSVHGEYDLYRSRGDTRVAASAGAVLSATRIDGKTYKGGPRGSGGIGVEISIGHDICDISAFSIRRPG
ncbi:hypothetical protein HPB52_011650 [Rhipicephalus sanguineus]|uniref:Uncharacterized protein n=1 Tax=Rhipicephalus sanguineus TaxID=34632 RepID=A0A9D4PGC3_RHISA|nr:hypothetical protein HPB52_011650 [Rhipicephalus sanguineus]